MKFPTIFSLIFALPCAGFAQDILIIGEIHDNPYHHMVQAEKVQEFKPAALVFEMLTAKQVKAIKPSFRNDIKALEKALNWRHSGWPDFTMYFPIMAAAPDARLYGAGIPRGQARVAMQQGVQVVIGKDTEKYGLDKPLPAAIQAKRVALQMAAHCDKLPEDLLNPMVMIQRLRDTILARETVQAFADTGGPVVVITGNGHTRRDWGVPEVLSRIAPELRVQTIGQTEDDLPLQGGYDLVLSSPAVERPDPCAVFK